jgi:hypothetical protein
MRLKKIAVVLVDQCNNIPNQDDKEIINTDRTPWPSAHKRTIPTD